MFARVLLLISVVAFAGCTNSNDLDEGPVSLGDFSLGHNIVVAPNMVKGPVSREASKEEWIASMTAAIGERFDRYEGDRLYHFGVSVEGYVLAQPGIPLVLSPKSVMIFNVTIWDDAAGEKLNTKVEQITVFESLSGDTLVGSGLTQSAEEQMANLSRNAAKMIQNWLVKQKRSKGWFRNSKNASSDASDPEEAAAVDTDSDDTDKVDDTKDAKDTNETVAESGDADAVKVEALDDKDMSNDDDSSDDAAGDGDDTVSQETKKVVSE